MYIKLKNHRLKFSSDGFCVLGYLTTKRVDTTKYIKVPSNNVTICPVYPRFTLNIIKDNVSIYHILEGIVTNAFIFQKIQTKFVFWNELIL
ncbi:hypothetical protein ASE46_00695 [Bacillus sp. Root239]|nr:hypothetical protein ASE46_00695 [Bacillus sp. Root239]